MGAILYVSSLANEYKSDEHCFRKTLKKTDCIEDKTLIKRTADELYKRSLKKGDVSATYVNVFDYGSRYYSELLANKPISERQTDRRIGKLFKHPEGAQNRFPGVTYSVLSLTVNGTEHSLKSALTKIELPEGEYDATLNIAYDYQLDTYNGKWIEEHFKFTRSCHLHLNEGYNFLQIKGTVFFEKTCSGDVPYTHEVLVYVFEIPSRLDFNMRLVPFKEFDLHLPGNQYDIPYPGNKYFKYGYGNDTLLTDEERNEELKKAELALSYSTPYTAARSDSSQGGAKASVGSAEDSCTDKKAAEPKKTVRPQPSVEKSTVSKPDRVGIYGRDSQLSKAMQILNDSSKEAVDELNASYNELMSVLRSNKPSSRPAPPQPKKPTPEEEAYKRRVDEFWAADKKAYEERIKQEKEEERKKEAEAEAERLRLKNAEEARLEAAERRRLLEKAEKERLQKEEKERKELEKRKKEELKAAVVKAPPKRTESNETSENELYLQYKSIFTFKGDTLLEYKGSSPNVTIPCFVKKIDNNFFSNKNIRSVKIEAEIHSVSERMFSHSEISEVILPKSVKRIEKYAFKGCKHLWKIDGGENISFIGEEAFMGCESLFSLGIHSSAVSLTLERACFKDCKALKSIHIKCAELPESCFENCGKLEAVYLKDTRSVGKKAFCNCTSLIKLGMDAIMKSNNEKVCEIIKESAFEKCRALKYISIPSKNISIENNAFSDCDSLCLVHFSYDPASKENGDISGRCDFAKAFVSCPSLKRIVYAGDSSFVKSLDPSGKCPFKIKGKLKEKYIK